LSVWIAEHRWVVVVIRLVGGLSLVAVAALAFGRGFPWARVIAFVVGAVLGDQAGEREGRRGDTLLETLRFGGDLPAPPESLPREFAEYFHQPPDPRDDGRYFGPR
jgi:hypothetical protein